MTAIPVSHRARSTNPTMDGVLWLADMLKSFIQFTESVWRREEAACAEGGVKRLAVVPSFLNKKRTRVMPFSRTGRKGTVRSTGSRNQI